MGSVDFRREIREQAQIAIQEADVILFLVDAKEGITAGDQDVAEVLRRSQKPVVLGANKADNAERRLAASSSMSSAWASHLPSTRCTARAWWIYWTQP